MFLAELREKHLVDDALFSSILHRGCKWHSTDTTSDSDTKNTGIGTASNVSFEN